MGLFAELSKADQVVYTERKTQESDRELKCYEVRIKISCFVLKAFCSKVMKFFSSSDATFPASCEFTGQIESIGESVKSVSVGENVCGILPMIGTQTAAEKYCIANCFSVVRIPAARSESECLSCIGAAVKGFTALLNHGCLKPGATVLIISDGKPQASVLTQLALSWKAKVIVAASSDDERMYMEKHLPEIAYIFDISSNKLGSGTSLVSSIKTETANLGTNIIIDLQQYDGSDSNTLVSKWEIIECLSVHGKWITSQPDLQLDPPESQQLFLRNASICFLFDASWQLTQSQQGKYCHMLVDIMEKIASGVLRGNIARVMSYSEAIKLTEPPADSIIGITMVHMD